MRTKTGKLERSARGAPPTALEPLRIKTIVVPLDGSALAEQALPWATAIAEKTRAKLRLILVHESPSLPLDEATARLFTKVELATRTAQRDYLRRQAARIKSERQVQVVTATLQGTPGPALERYLDEMTADLVVMTTHARGGLQRAWLGSVADRLVRSLDVPMLLVRPTDVVSPEAIGTVREILVPLDGSRRAEAALAPALAMASAFGARLVLLQAVYPVPLVTDPPTSFPMEIDDELTAMQRGQAQDYVDGLAERISAGGVPASGAAVLGTSAFDAIESAARAPGTGMVVLATHGRGGLRRLVLGSVADKLVRGGRLPVLVTRPSGR